MLATPMTAAPKTVPRILTVPRDRTEDSATHGETQPVGDTRRDMSLLITSIHTIICSGITENLATHLPSVPRLPSPALHLATHNSCGLVAAQALEEGRGHIEMVRGQQTPSCSSSKDLKHG